MNWTQFVNVASRSVETAVRDAVAAAAGVTGRIFVVHIHFSWLLFGAQTLRRRFHLHALPAPPPEVRHDRTNLDRAAHRRRPRRSASQNRTGFYSMTPESSLIESLTYRKEKVNNCYEPF